MGFLCAEYRECNDALIPFGQHEIPLLGECPNNPFIECQDHTIMRQAEAGFGVCRSELRFAGSHYLY